MKKEKKRRKNIETTAAKEEWPARPA